MTSDKQGLVMEADRTKAKKFMDQIKHFGVLVNGSFDFSLLDNDLPYLLAAERLSTLDLPELKDLLMYAGHTRFCDMPKICSCGYSKVYEDFQKLKASLKEE